MDPAKVHMVPQKSHRTVWIAIAVVIVVIIGVVAVMYALKDTTKPVAVTANSSTTTVTETVATKDEVKQNLSDADTSIKQAAVDQTAAKDAQNEGDSQITIGN